MATKAVAQAVTRILAPVDFSPGSCEAAKYAISLARQLGASVICMTVIDVLDLRVAMKAGLRDFETNADLQRQVSAWIDKEFDKLTAGADVEVKREVRRGIPEDEILASVRRNKPDLVVMGSSGIGRVFPIGSRTRAILNGTTVPVLVVRSPEKKKR